MWLQYNNFPKFHCFWKKKCLYFSKVLFNFFCGYFSDILMTSSIFEDICDGIRNICEGIGFSHTFYVYRHANLCSGLRAILSPQLIKKNLQFWAYFRGSGTAQIRTRIAWFTAQCSSNELLNRLMGCVLLSVFIYLIYT